MLFKTSILVALEYSIIKILSRMKRIFLWLTLLSVSVASNAQESFPVNGIRDIRSGLYAFTNATIVQTTNSKIEKGTLLI